MSDDAGGRAHAKKIVKTFSWKAYGREPDNELAKSLVKVEAAGQDSQREGTTQEQWLELFDPAVKKALQERDEIILAEPTEDLAQAYKKFLKCLPKEHAARIEDGPPRLDVVLKAVSVAQVSWKNKRENTKTGQAKEVYSKVVRSLYGHRDLFAMIPSSDKYVSLVAGSLTAIIKATMNYEEITEAISDALDDVSDDIAYWKEMLREDENRVRTEHFISRMYAVIFKFFATIMTKWSSKSSFGRMIRSFDKEFLESEVEKKRQKIRDLNDKLTRQSDVAMHRKIDRLEQSQAEAQAVLSRAMLELSQQQMQLGSTIKNSLIEEFQSYFRQQIEAPRSQRLLSNDSAKRKLLTGTEGVESPDICHTGAELKSCALQLLAPYTVPQDVYPLIEDARSLNINIEILQRLKQWNESNSSRLLWIQGPFQEPQPSKYTLISAYIIMTAQKANIMTLYHFCNLETTVVDLVYSLTAQLVQGLLEDKEMEKGISAGRLKALDQSVETLDMAIGLFSDLLAWGPPMIYIIIDGVQNFERSTADVRLLQRLVRMLRDLSYKRSAREGLIKTLFTTDGFTDALIDTDMDERVNGAELGVDDGGPDLDGTEIDYLE